MRIEQGQVRVLSMKHLNACLLAVSALILSACSDNAINPTTTLDKLQVQQFHSKTSGTNYRYCVDCVHFTQLNKEIKTS